MEWRLLQCHIEDYLPLFVFLAATGTRFGEAAALYARDFSVSSEGHTLIAITCAWTRDEQNRPVMGPPKTSKSKRAIHLETGIAQGFSQLLLESAQTGRHLFASASGGPIDHRRAWEVWNRAVKAARLSGLTKQPRIHDLRHLNASWLLQAGLDIYKLQIHLGHESITTTLDRYSHLLPEGTVERARFRRSRCRAWM
ncbi:site-specific integrase [Arthrobacter cheniae]|uniref:Site-specific integrase n=1 Tax=Arthrobacter cheniae TaxID=1258888 RepID=A0A3A5LXY1_9MICC|nr:site-specific integrase [Arthrobacter cheniae]